MTVPLEKTLLVTDASTGIDRAVAIGCARHGADNFLSSTMRKRSESHFYALTADHSSYYMLDETKKGGECRCRRSNMFSPQLLG